MISRFFIDRPIFATVISILITLAGLLAIRVLPVAQYPELVPPEVNVSTVYPGASADVIAKTVAAPLEQEINGVDNMLYLQSSSSGSGALSMSITFKLGTDPDQATINVNNRVQAALAGLPAEVRQQGVTVKKRSPSMLEVVTIESDGRYDSVYMGNYALINVLDDLKRVEGVGDAMIFGNHDYSMRVWIRPDKLAQLKLTPSDIANAIREQNAQFAAGGIGLEPLGDPVELTYTVTTQGRLADENEFGNIILRANPDGTMLRLKDVARVELGAYSYSVVSKHNGNDSIAIGVYLAPGANALDTADRVSAKMEEISKRFPDGIEYKIPFDTTEFIRISVNEVVHTLFEAMALVFIIIFIFLQNWRATVIPCLAVPVSIIGTFAGMYILGFSVNTLTLFGLVLAIGIVVDDAIVVIENVERIMETEGLNPHDATVKAMEEVTGPVIAIVLVLCSVFIPVAFMGGLAGEMYKQFAVTIAVSVILSGIVALTLTPALCSLLLKQERKAPIAPLRWFNSFFDRITARYTAGVRFILKRTALGVSIFALLCGATWMLFQHVPGSLVPEEDQGYIISAAFLPDGASLSRTQAVTDKVSKMMLDNPAIQDTIEISGFDLFSGSPKTNSSTIFLNLTDWDKRDESQSSNAVVGNIFGYGYGFTDALVMAFNPPPISGMSNTGGFEGYVQNRAGDDPREMARKVQAFAAEANKRPELTAVRTTFSANAPQIHVDLDREKAKSLGVPVNRVFETMQSTFGAYYVNDFNKLGRTFRVQLQSEGEYRKTPDDLKNVYVRSENGKMIPLTALVNIRQETGPDVLERFNVFPAAKVMGSPAPGYSSGQALEVMEELAHKYLPESYTLSWTGSAYQEKATGGTSAQVLLLALLMVFLILAAQYERWSLPFAVIMVVPFALFGAISANFLRGLSNDVYFQIALVTLIGLSCKNAILIVEFAAMIHREGKDIMHAAAEAARLRFRPIVMTSLAFILGCMPLATSHGAGAASRHSIGTGVIGGMLAATFIATFFIPAFYMTVASLTEKSRGISKKVKNRRKDEQ